MIQALPDINFLKTHRKILLIAAKRSFLVQIASFSILGIFVLLVTGAFSYNAYLGIRLRQTDASISRATNAIEQLSTIESEYFVLKSKTSETVEIVSSLSKHQRIIETVFQIIPEGVYVEGVVINEEGDIEFNAETNDSEKLEQFIAILENNLTGGLAIIDRAAIDNISISEEGLYTFSTVLRLNVDGGV
jgi:Tfp pilus assembly protein PilN